eukprot:453720_1
MSFLNNFIFTPSQYSTNNNFSQGLRNRFSNMETSPITNAASSFPPITNSTKDTRNKHQILTAFHEVTLCWMEDCKENKKDYTDAALNCIQQMTGDVENRQYVFADKIQDLEFIGLKARCVWTVNMLNEWLWPGRINPYTNESAPDWIVKNIARRKQIASASTNSNTNNNNTPTATNNNNNNVNITSIPNTPTGTNNNNYNNNKFGDLYIFKRLLLNSILLAI